MELDIFEKSGTWERVTFTDSEKKSSEVFRYTFTLQVKVHEADIHNNFENENGRRRWQARMFHSGWYEPDAQVIIGLVQNSLQITKTTNSEVDEPVLVTGIDMEPVINDNFFRIRVQDLGQGQHSVTFDYMFPCDFEPYEIKFQLLANKEFTNRTSVVDHPSRPPNEGGRAMGNILPALEITRTEAFRDPIDHSQIVIYHSQSFKGDEQCHLINHCVLPDLQDNTDNTDGLAALLAGGQDAPVTTRTYVQPTKEELHCTRQLKPIHKKIWVFIRYQNELIVYYFPKEMKLVDLVTAFKKTMNLAGAQYTVTNLSNTRANCKKEYRLTQIPPENKCTTMATFNIRRLKFEDR